MTATQEAINRMRKKVDERKAKANGAAHEHDAKPHQPRFRLKTVGDVSAAGSSTWLVRDLIPTRGLLMIYGAPGSGKSFVGFDLGAHLVRKLPWANRRVRRARVIYIALEGTMVERLAAYRKHHVLAAADLDGMTFVERVAFDLRKSEDVGELIADIRAQIAGYTGHFLILVDTLARATPGANENSSEDMGAAIAAAERIANEFGSLVGLIHHCGKDPARGSRGWSGMLGACDVEILCERNERRRTLTFTKVKDAEDGFAFDFTLEVIDIGPRAEVDPDAGPDERRSSCVAVVVGDEVERPSPAQAKALGKNQMLLAAKLRADGPMIRARAMAFMESANIPRRSRYAVIDSLLTAGVIEDTISGLRAKE